MTIASCKVWFAYNAKADEWALKLKLVEKYSRGSWGVYFIIENTPCWTYTPGRTDADGADAVTKITTTYDDKGCWYGVCRQHAYVYTSIFQERVKGQYNSVSGYSTNAMFVGTIKHVWVEVYVKDKGYYVCDVGDPFPRLIPRSCHRNPKPSYMCNRWITGNEGYCDATLYQPLWAGPEIAPPPPPSKTYIKASSSPTGARIWLRKHPTGFYDTGKTTPSTIEVEPYAGYDVMFKLTGYKDKIIPNRSSGITGTITEVSATLEPSVTPPITPPITPPVTKTVTFKSVPAGASINAVSR